MLVWNRSLIFTIRKFVYFRTARMPKLKSSVRATISRRFLFSSVFSSVSPAYQVVRVVEAMKTTSPRLFVI